MNYIFMVIRRINKDGSIKDNEEVEKLGDFSIVLKEGTNTIKINRCSAQIKAKWIIKNDLTDAFVPTVNLGTRITQNSKAVQIAWNQISEKIQADVVNNKASLSIYDKNDKRLMNLDENGQHFYANEENFGSMGVAVREIQNENNEITQEKYITFTVESDYGNDIKNGMAWGIKTKDDNKFYPIIYIKNFHMGSKGSDETSGELVLASCNMILDGIGTGIQTGDLKLMGDSAGGMFYFYDTKNDKCLMSIGNNLLGEQVIKILDKISMYENQGGSHTLKVGTEDSYVYITSDGWVSASSQVYSKGDISAEGYVYGKNISSDKKFKDNIKDSNINAIDIIKKIKHRQFDRNDENNKHYEIGYIAQEIEKVDTSFVIIRPKTDKTEETYYINELPLIATLTKAMQELTTKVEELENKIKEMEEK